MWSRPFISVWSHCILYSILCSIGSQNTGFLSVPGAHFLLNNLPVDIRQTDSAKTFKSKLWCSSFDTSGRVSVINILAVGWDSVSWFLCCRWEINKQTYDNHCNFFRFLFLYHTSCFLYLYFSPPIPLFSPLSVVPSEISIFPVIFSYSLPRHHAIVSLSPIVRFSVSPICVNAATSMFVRSVLLPGLHGWNEVMWLRFYQATPEAAQHPPGSILFTYVLIIYMYLYFCHQTL